MDLIAREVPSALPAVALAGAVLAYAVALLAWRRGQPRLALAGVVLGGMGLRLYASCDGFLHAWDERFHALVAKNLMAHPLRPTLYDNPLLPYDHSNWLENGVWLHKPPLALWLMALAMAVLGVGELALRVPSLFLSATGTYATYRIGKEFQGHDVGLLAAFFHSANAFLVLLAAGWFATDHVDTSLVSLVALAVAAGVVGGGRPASFVATGLLSGLAVLSKGLPGLLAPAIVALWHARELPRGTLLRRGALSFAAALVVAAPWWLYTSVVFPAEAAWERAYEWRHIVEPLEGHAGSPLFHLALLPKIYGELVYLPLLFWLVRVVRGPRDSKTLALTAWILIPYAIFSFSASKMPAYVMVAAPAVFLVVADFCRWLLAQWQGGRRRILVGLALAAMIVLPVRILLNDLRLFREHVRRPAWVAELRDLERRLAGRRAVIFGSERPIETMFYTSHVAYAAVPDRSIVEALQGRGYRVLVYESDSLPADRRGWPDVEYLR